MRVFHSAPLTAFVSSTLDLADLTLFSLVVFSKEVLCNVSSNHRSKEVEIKGL